MLITPADVKARFPEFAAILDARVQLFIDEAVLQINVNSWGRYYTLGLYYLTAHNLTIAEASAAGANKGSGMIASQSVGDTSVSFVSPAVDSDMRLYYQQTVYGQRFLLYATMIGAGGFVV